MSERTSQNTGVILYSFNNSVTSFKVGYNIIKSPSLLKDFEMIKTKRAYHPILIGTIDSWCHPNLKHAIKNMFPPYRYAANDICLNILSFNAGDTAVTTKEIPFRYAPHKPIHT